MRRVLAAGAFVLVALAVLIAFPLAAEAAPIYVSAFGSDDAGDGLLPITGFATVQHAIDVATWGDIIYVGAGTFAGGITTKDGVSLQGAGPSETTLIGTSTVVSANSVYTDISGFTITGNGRGIECGSDYISITNNTITGNTTAGIYSASASPNITNNTITGNGDGIVCYSSPTSSSITGNTITENSGDGIYCWWSPSNITSNTISGNSGDGIYCEGLGSSSNITSNTITGNTGVGIHGYRSMHASITNNTITGNGDGIYCWRSSSASITGNTIAGNTGDGISCYSSSPRIKNNIVTGNTGRGVCCWQSSSPSITNNTIRGNWYGVYCDASCFPSITNCILWSNSYDLSMCSATYSDIEHRTDAAGVGNITSAPSFVSTASGDYHLKASSPCIDKGTSVAAPTTDKDGTPRPCGGGYDMGAYEYHAATYQLHYAAGSNGTLSGTTSQTVDFQGSGSAVTATPTVGHHFVSWSDGKTTNPRTDTSVTADGTYTASFAANPYQLNYIADSGGSVSGTTAQTVYYKGSGSLVRAIAGTGYHFVSWSDGVTTPYRTDADVTADATYTAAFAINTYQLRYTADSGGTVSGTTSQTVDHNGSGSAVTAVPDTGYHFTSWSDGVTTAMRADGDVIADATYTAMFDINTPHQLHYTAGSGGTLSGTASQTVDYDASGTPVTAVPNANYHFVEWSDDSTANPRTDTNVTDDRSIAAVFAIDTYTVAYRTAANGSIVGSATQTVDYGTAGFSVTASPTIGYHFVEWSDHSTVNPRTDTNIASDATYTATFAINTYSLKYAPGSGGTLSGITSQTVDYRTSGTLVTAVPSLGHHFVGWSDGITSDPRTDADVTANVDVVAQFAINTYALKYLAGTGGALTGAAAQTVEYNTSGAAVTAVPNAGYRFVKWSDGIITATRTDNGVVADKTVTAEFAKVINTALVYRTPAKSTVTYTRKRGVAKFTLSAVIKGWGSKAVTSHYVYLQSSKNGRSWSNTYRIKTSSTGKASKAFKVTTKRVRYYRWYVPAKSQTCLKTYSKQTKVTVR